jgi:hypothetical protein
MSAFALGNGVSRQVVSIDHLMRHGGVYACNGVYRTHTVTALVATDYPIAKIIQESGYSKRNRFYTRRPLPNLGAHCVPKEYFGYSSGPIAIALAALDKSGTIYMLGFDMGPDSTGKFNNVFAGTEFYKAVGSTPTYSGNWIKQTVKIINDFPKQHFIRVVGASTADVPEFNNLKNFNHIPMDAFIDRINTGKDL